MTVPKTLPAPRRNLAGVGLTSRDTGIASSDIIVALGDYTGGAAEDLFTLASHGLVDGDVLYVVWQSAVGAITGGEGTRCVVNELSSSTFQCTTDGTTTIENTADGTVAFIKGTAVPQRVIDNIINQLVIGSNDTTGGTVEDMVSAGSGSRGVLDGDTLKLLYKSASGAAAVAVDATVYVKTPVTGVALNYFQTSLTSGGAVADTTQDGTVIFLKTS